MGISFRVEQRNSPRQAVIAPDLHNVGNEFGLLIKVFPRSFATIVGIVFEGHERQILDASMSFQVIEETPEPGRPSLRIGPHLNVLSHAFEDRSAELEIWIDAMQRSCKLQVKSGVIFGLHIL